MTVLKSFVFILSVFGASASLASTAPVLSQKWEQKIHQIMKREHIPGLAVAIIKDDKVVEIRTFGYRDIAKKLPVGPDTVFPASSVTKTFSAFGTMLLVDKGAIALDQPVATYLPDLQLWNAEVTKNVTLRDVFTHQTGLGIHNLLWYGSPLTEDEVYSRLRYLEPTYGLRETFQYSSLPFLVAGELMHRVSGVPWRDYMRREVLEPLGMARSSLTFNEMIARGDFATPYLPILDMKDRIRDLKPIPHRDGAGTGPGIALNSSVTDLANWLIMNINGGKFLGKQILSQKALAEMHTPQITVGDPSNKKYYGLGWYLSTYISGEKIISHTGFNDGMIAYMGFMPDKKLGVVALSNQAFYAITQIAAFTAFDEMLQHDPWGWDTSFSRTYHYTAPPIGIGPEMGQLPGVYEHPAYGQLRIVSGPQGPTLEYNDFKSPIGYEEGPERYSVFEPRLNRTSGHTYFKTEIGPDMTVSAVIWDVWDKGLDRESTRIRFVRVP
jgi:CubicO group peptidase (beta-lactamase class C family)